ncbi:MAG: triose-phosphate isomerase [Alphaproteobacteria bacterium]|jgi:triosephosphate isomerase (TIM)|nr:triose-phosphate isomerase [Alphaproteobacteria bacterium]MBT5389284.1 triose-phosphate isomerase [Alphaproteobacteria bacterium]MBT5540670.1 triose-phosphate isomerase [Alphaproteobacteria bacterium]MBT5654176.1 triose-phosphate isomerase [Alphaproteobacteria bacterium]
MTKIIVGNWKMNFLQEEGASLASEICNRVANEQPFSAQVILCPPLTLIDSVSRIAKEGPVQVGGQDCGVYANGAYTGDVSAQMLKDFGCTHVILGHSERRRHHQETNDLVKRKAIKALEAGLIPIICVGETQEERQRGETMNTLLTQARESVPLEGATFQNVLVAYEPVWAIGTGETPQPDEVQEVHEGLKKGLAEASLRDEQFHILYGGSVTAQNAKEFLSIPAISGLLVGGASLKVEDFWKIIVSSD